jgi:hypothetical protein
MRKLQCTFNFDLGTNLLNYVYHQCTIDFDRRLITFPDKTTLHAPSTIGPDREIMIHFPNPVKLLAH